MSRIGKKEIIIPKGVDMQISGDIVIVKGPKGELKQKFPKEVLIGIEGEIARVSVLNPDDKDHRSLWGLFQRLITNMIKGVTEGYEKKLEMIGVGFKGTAAGKKLTLDVGFSHPVIFDAPEGIEVSIDKNLVITVKGTDKQLVGETAARIRKIKKPEPYKGKGIKYAGEVIRRKAGKAAKGSA
jgi:large subunit ribosomal protein L6